MRLICENNIWTVWALRELLIKKVNDEITEFSKFKIHKQIGFEISDIKNTISNSVVSKIYENNNESKE